MIEVANRVVMVNVPKIKKLASQKNMTLKQLESVAGIANGIIAKWIYRDAQIDKVYRVADVLSTSIDELIEKV